MKAALEISKADQAHRPRPPVITRNQDRLWYRMRNDPALNDFSGAELQDIAVSLDRHLVIARRWWFERQWFRLRLWPKRDSTLMIWHLGYWRLCWYSWIRA